MAVMLNMLLDAIYSDVIQASISGMEIQGAGASSTPATSAAWLSELIETLDSVGVLPAPHQNQIEACHAQLRLPTRSAQLTLH